MAETPICGAVGERGPSPHLVSMCARPRGHEGDHCNVLHKFGEREKCPRCTSSESPA